MYEPKFKITNGILNNLIKFEILKTKIESTDLNDALVASMKARAKAMDILHVGHLVGLNLTFRDAEKIASGKRLQTEDARGSIVVNLRNVHEFIRSNVADSYGDIDNTVLLHINKILLTDWRETWESKYRIGGEETIKTFDNWLHLEDISIDPSEIQAQVDELIAWYKSTISKMHPILRVGVFVYRLIRISPFVALNKLTTIALVDYLLFKNNYLQGTFIPTSRNFDIYEDEYLEAFNAAIQGKYNPESEEVEMLEDMTLWLERFTRNLSNDILEIREIINREISEKDTGSKQPFLELNKRQLKILKYLQTIPTVKREDYVQMMNVSTMTAFRDMTDLVKKKLVKIEGTGRATKYMLASR